MLEDEHLFPAGSLQLDCGLAMSRIEHEWHSLGEISYAAAGSARAGLTESITSA